MAVNLNITDTVKEILTKHPETKDNDEYLILKVWVTQNPNLKTALFIDFARSFKSGKFANTESIRRSRAQLQKEYPELRGNAYEQRMAKQSKIKEQLKNNF